MKPTPPHLTSVLSLVLVCLCLGCTLPHSKAVLWPTQDEPPTNAATFVTVEDSGLALLGVFQISEPDHYAVLLERARRRYKCDALHSGQLDFYTDHWIIVAFPISRLTLVCERHAPAPEPKPQPPRPNPKPSTSVQ